MPGEVRRRVPKSELRLEDIRRSREKRSKSGVRQEDFWRGKEKGSKISPVATEATKFLVQQSWKHFGAFFASLSYSPVVKVVSCKPADGRMTQWSQHVVLKLLPLPLHAVRKIGRHWADTNTITLAFFFFAKAHMVLSCSRVVTPLLHTLRRGPCCLLVMRPPPVCGFSRETLPFGVRTLPSIQTIHVVVSRFALRERVRPNAQQSDSLQATSHATWFQSILEGQTLADLRKVRPLGLSARCHTKTASDKGELASGD